MKILDSGKRTKFETGAIRDAQVGKGRMDLLPCRALQAARLQLFGRKPIDSAVLYMMDWLKGDRQRGNISLKLACRHSLDALERKLSGIDSGGDSFPLALIEVAKIFEGGASKYTPRNWEKGIPLSRFVDSGLRHALKYMAAHTDEDHLAMCCWNFLCCLDTLERIKDGVLPKELDDLPNLEDNS